MSKIIVYYEGAKVTGYENVEANMLEAACFGLKGEDAVAFDRAIRALGRDVVARFMSTTPKKDADAALADIAGTRGRAYILADPRMLPDGAFETWAVKGGTIVKAG